MNKMKIEIWSDIACPYCYIGKRKIEKALEQFSDADNVSVIWHSYELNPLFPKGNSGKSYFQHLAELKECTVEEAEHDFQEIIQLGKEVGIIYNPNKIITTNTHDALRLVKLANKYNLANEAEEVLFKAHFTDGEDISNTDILIRLLSSIGIPKADVIRSLDSFEYSEDIKKDIIKSEEELNLEYIPFCLLNNKYKIQGSVTIEEYLDIIKTAYQDWSENGENSVIDNETDAIKGKSCSIDGTCSL